MSKTMNSPKGLARIAGVLYLLVGIFGGFAEGFVDPKMYVAGNAAATAGNVVANAGLVRMGVVAHLVDGVFFVLTALTSTSCFSTSTRAWRGQCWSSSYSRPASSL